MQGLRAGIVGTRSLVVGIACHAPFGFIGGFLLQSKTGRPYDGSHQGAWMYGTEGQLSASGYPEAVQGLHDWHNRLCGRYSEFGYENLIPNLPEESGH